MKEGGGGGGGGTKPWGDFGGWGDKSFCSGFGGGYVIRVLGV